MKRPLLFLVFVAVASFTNAQRVDSIFFHLYTDSLKKGTHNYINVDGKLADGKWLPMTSKEIDLVSSTCEFSGNDLVIPADFAGEKIMVKARLKGNPSMQIETTIWIKKKPDPEILPAKEETRIKNKKPRNKE